MSEDRIKELEAENARLRQKIDAMDLEHAQDEEEIEALGVGLTQMEDYTSAVQGEVTRLRGMISPAISVLAGWDSLALWIEQLRVATKEGAE